MNNIRWISRLLVLLYFLGLPFMFLAIVYLFQLIGVEFEAYPHLLLPFRVIAILASIATMSAPWWLDKRKSGKPVRYYRLPLVPKDAQPMFLRLSFAVIPTFYGFVLFALGGSFYEFALFMAVAIIGVVGWGVYSFRKDTGELAT